MNPAVRNLIVIAISLFALALLGSRAWAGQVGTMTTFTSGTPAVAADVNGNFSAVKTAVDDNDTRINNLKSNTEPGALKTEVDKITPIINNTQAGTLKTEVDKIGGIIANTEPGALKTLVDNLASGVPGASCTGIDASDVMDRVGPICVDRYEATVWTSPAGGTEGSQKGISSDDYGCNDDGSDCSGVYARSHASRTPSTYVTWFQAARACMNSGKRLLTNAEWQMAVMGTPDIGANSTPGAGCNTSLGSKALSGAFSCTSVSGTRDMVGNVWEWVADWVQGDTTAYAASSSTTVGGGNDDHMVGVNPATSGAGGTTFLSALIRGGNNSDGVNAGFMALAADSSPLGAFAGVGFRCAR